MNWIYDIETYPNCFLISLIREDGKFERTIEVSEFLDESERLFTLFEYLADNEISGVGFNNKGFDYPVLHDISVSKTTNVDEIYYFAQRQIKSAKDGNGFPRVVKDSDEFFPQIDLYKIWHFDNKAKATSLKKLEFNMRSDNIEELPFTVGTHLTKEQIAKLRIYNMHDVKETLKFYKHSSSQIEFRKFLTQKYGRNFMNHNDTKIGKDYFVMRLEEAGIQLYEKVQGQRKLRQSPRPVLKLKNALFDYYDFKRPEFNAVKDWIASQIITETKGVFTEIPEHRLGEVAKYANMRVIKRKFNGEPKDIDVELFKSQYPMGWVEEITLKAVEAKKRGGGNKKSYWKSWNHADVLNVVIDGFQFNFGTGGIHGSITDKIARCTNSYKLLDADVTSMYPNVGIANRVYPEHLSEKFCDIYQDVFEQRKQYDKKSVESSMLKLALNGVYGDSNNQYSPFYDPLYTMKITLNGQLSLCLLAERLMEIEGLKMVQINTDGVTVACPRDKEDEYYRVCKEWQDKVKLNLEFAEYEKMYIRDVNNYIAVYTDGKVKRKGAYEYDQTKMVGNGWHTDLGGLIIPKAAEACMLHGANIEEYIRNHKDWFDFMKRIVVPKSSSLFLETDKGDIKQQNVTRYYISNNGGYLIKVMPPLSAEKPERRFGVGSNFKAKTCNNMLDFDGDIDYDYYINEAKKLLIGQYKIDNPVDIKHLEKEKEDEDD